MNKKQQKIYEKLIKELNEFENTTRWSEYLQFEEGDYDCALVDVLVKLEELVYFEDESKIDGIKGIRFYLNCIEIADDLSMKIDWDESFINSTIQKL